MEDVEMNGLFPLLTFAFGGGGDQGLNPLSHIPRRFLYFV